MKRIRDLYVYFICFMQVIFMFLLYLANEKLDVYSNFVYVAISLLFMLIQISFFLKKYKLGLIVSIVFIINVLFIRRQIEVDNYFNFNIYLDYWFSHIENEVVFYNVVGNIFVFIPLAVFIYFYLNDLIKTFIYVFVIICLIEIFQALLKLGIFDIVDILLNYFGVVFVLLGVRLWGIKRVKNNN